MAKSDHPTPVSPFLDRTGLDPAPAPEPNLHLLAGIWVASCPTCTTGRFEARRAADVWPHGGPDVVTFREGAGR
jgi:hypothetical protein